MSFDFTSPLDVVPTSEEEYFSHPAISQSDLGLLEKSPQLFDKKKNGNHEEESKSYFDLGSQFDCLILTPDEWDSRYVVEPAGINKPSSGQQTAFVEQLKEGFTPVEAYANCYSTGRLKDETVEKKAKELATELQPWITFEGELDGRMVVSGDQWDLLQNMRAAVMADPQSSRVMLNPHEEGVEVLTQLIILFNIGQHQCKAMLDRVIIHHAEKIVELWDLKSTAKPLSKFHDAYYDYGYDRQHGWYGEALWQHLAGVVDNTWTLRAGIVACTTKGFIEARAFLASNTHLTEGRRKNYDLLKDLELHQETGNWTQTAEAIRTGGYNLLRAA